MKRTILSLGVVAALAANTYGAGQVWYSAVSNGGTASVTTQGVAGGQTVLQCTGNGSWAITVHYTLADGGAAGWALDHYATGAGTLASAGGLTVTSAGFTSGVTNGTVDNAGQILMQGQSGQAPSAAGVGPGDFVLESWTLTSTNCSNNILAGIGNTEFGGDDAAGFGVYEVVQLGSNAARPGFSNGGGDPLGAEPIAVIRVTPEPTTLSLLAFGALALIRRRR